MYAIMMDGVWTYWRLQKKRKKRIKKIKDIQRYAFYEKITEIRNEFKQPLHSKNINYFVIIYLVGFQIFR